MLDGTVDHHRIALAHLGHDLVLQRLIAAVELGHHLDLLVVQLLAKAQPFRMRVFAMPDLARPCFLRPERYRLEAIGQVLGYGFRDCVFGHDFPSSCSSGSSWDFGLALRLARSSASL